MAVTAAAALSDRVPPLSDRVPPWGGHLALSAGHTGLTQLADTCEADPVLSSPVTRQVQKGRALVRGRVMLSDRAGREPGCHSIVLHTFGLTRGEPRGHRREARVPPRALARSLGGGLMKDCVLGSLPLWPWCSTVPQRRHELWASERASIFTATGTGVSVSPQQTRIPSSTSRWTSTRRICGAWCST